MNTLNASTAIKGYRFQRNLGYRVNTIFGVVDFKGDKRSALKEYRKWDKIGIAATLEIYTLKESNDA